MSIICGICRDKLISTNRNTSDSEDLQPVTTTCGHLFHNSCLTKWFETEIEILGPRAGRSCPYCKKMLNMPTQLQRGFHRVFPDFPHVDDYEGLEIENNRTHSPEVQNLKAVISAHKQSVGILKTELQQAKEMVEKLSGEKLEAQTRFRDLLQVLRSVEEENQSLRSTRNRYLKFLESEVDGQPKPKSETRLRSDAVDDLAVLNQPAPALPPKPGASAAIYKANRELELGDHVLYKSMNMRAGPLPYYSGTVKAVYLNKFQRKMAVVEFDQRIPRGRGCLLTTAWQYLTSKLKNGRVIEVSRLIRSENSSGSRI